MLEIFEKNLIDIFENCWFELEKWTREIISKNIFNSRNSSLSPTHLHLNFKIEIPVWRTFCSTSSTSKKICVGFWIFLTQPPLPRTKIWVENCCRLPLMLFCQSPPPPNLEYKGFLVKFLLVTSHFWEARYTLFVNNDEKGTNRRNPCETQIVCREWFVRFMSILQKTFSLHILRPRRRWQILFSVNSHVRLSTHL